MFCGITIAEDIAIFGESEIHPASFFTSAT
jgi:hypothetical protein